MNIHVVKFIAFGLLLTFLAACGSTSEIEDAEPGLPDWYLNPPEDNEEFLYTIGESESQVRGTARDQARVSAQGAMAQKLGTTVESLQRLFEEELSSAEEDNYRSSWTNAIRSITEQELTGGTEESVDFIVHEETGRYEAFVLYKLPVGYARSQLENSLAQEEELYIRFRESEAFEELDEHLERLSNEADTGIDRERIEDDENEDEN